MGISGPPLPLLADAEAKGAELEDADIERLRDARDAARKARNFIEADRIRDELAAKRIILEDGAGLTTWKRI